MLLDFYDRQGYEIDGERWKKLSKDCDYTRIRETMVHGYLVYTSWNGIHKKYSKEKFFLFETCVYNYKKKKFEEIISIKYMTESEAIEGHEDVVKMIQDGDIEWKKVKKNMEKQNDEKS